MGRATPAQIAVLQALAKVDASEMTRDDAAVELKRVLLTMEREIQEKRVRRVLREGTTP